MFFLFYLCLQARRLCCAPANRLPVLLIVMHTGMQRLCLQACHLPVGPRLQDRERRQGPLKGTPRVVRAMSIGAPVAVSVRESAACGRM